MRILIVGAGAIGQVYAYHLKMAGNEVYFYVKAKYVGEMQEELAIYPLNRPRSREAPVRFKVDGVLTSSDELAKSNWDQVYLCISSTGLEDEWLERLAQSIPVGTLILLQSGLDDVNTVLKFFPKERIVSGMLSIISYHAPLKGESVPVPGMAFWFPPFSPSPFSGESSRTHAVVATLNKGGYPAKVVDDVPSLMAFPSALLMCLISGLELAHWSFKTFKDHSRLREVCETAREVALVISRVRNQKVPWMMKFIRPATLHLVMRLAQWMIPLDIETYLKAHFTKVADQTRLYMGGYLEKGKALGIPTPKLKELTTALNNC